MGIVATSLPAEGPVPSPCINVCRLDPDSGLCVGCHRTLDEIAAWSRMDDREKRAVWALLSARAATPSADPGQETA